MRFFQVISFRQGAGALVFAALLAAASPLGAGQATGGGESGHPNVVLIVVDTLRADYLSCYGFPQISSPSIDSKLAQRGVRFAHATAHVPLTGPSHATMFTSLYPQKHGAVRNGVPVAESVETLAQIFKRNGYATGAFVSGWTLLKRMAGLDKGFDVYDDEMTSRYRVVNTKRSAEETLPNALAWLQGRAGEKKPFFMFLHFFDPHAPYRAHPEWASCPPNPEADARWTDAANAMERPWRNARKAERYRQEVSFVDFYVGKFLDALETMELTKRTLIVLTSDHGESLGEHGSEGHGRQLYETDLRVPLIARFDSRIPKGKVIQGTAAHIDLAPTLLDWAGIEPRFGAGQFQGISLRPWMENNERVGSLPAREIYIQSYPGAVGHVPHLARWLLRQKSSLTPIRLGLVAYPYKVIYTPSSDTSEVYDAARDPWERTNVFSRTPRYRDSGERLVRWHRATSSSIPKIPSLSSEDREKIQSLGYVQ